MSPGLPCALGPNISSSCRAEGAASSSAIHSSGGSGPAMLLVLLPLLLANCETTEDRQQPQFTPLMTTIATNSGFLLVLCR
jgi:hypothetical protein